MRSKRKLVIITGGGSGIGKAAAKKFLENNHIVIIIGRNEVKLRKTYLELLKISKNIEYRASDVTNSKAVLDVFSSIFYKYKRIDILVNNAGFSAGKDFETSNLDDWQEEIAINLTGTYICSKEAVKYMKKMMSGVFVNISSDRGRVGSNLSTGYAASKAGVINLTKSLAIQLAKYNIRANCICPSAIDNTDISRNWSKSLKENIKNKVPMKRLGTPEDIASLIYFLSQEESSFITGATIDANGGFLIY